MNWSFIRLKNQEEGKCGGNAFFDSFITFIISKGIVVLTPFGLFPPTGDDIHVAHVDIKMLKKMMALIEEEEAGHGDEI